MKSVEPTKFEKEEWKSHPWQEVEMVFSMLEPTIIVISINIVINLLLLQN